MNKAKLLNIILLFLCLLYAGNAMGQSFTLQGKVSDQDGNPIELASIMQNNDEQPERRIQYAAAKRRFGEGALLYAWL